MENYLTRRLVSKEITAATAVIDALMLSAKNVRNSTIFLINNIITAYEYNTSTKLFDLKKDLHNNQVENLELINKIIPLYNKHASSKKLKPGQKVKTLNLYTEHITSITRNQILNHKLIEQTLKSAEALKIQSLKAYDNTHSYIAQYTLQKTIDDFKNWFKALTAYYKNKEVFTGRPEMPFYKQKNDRSTIEFNISRLSNDGTLMQVEKLNLYQMYPDQNAVSNEIKKLYKKINFKQLIADDLKANGLKGTPKSIRFVSLNNSKHDVKVEYVLALKDKEIGECKQILNVQSDFFNLKPEEQIEAVTNYYANKTLPRIMGIDLGYTNWATLSYSDKKVGSNRVISAKGYLAKINEFDAKIDLRKSELAKSSPEYQSLSKRRLDKEKLTKAEKFKLRQHEIAMNSDSILRKLWKQKTQFIKDYIHKLSKAILQEACNRKSKYIVVGKNKFWKQELNLGKETNRKGHNLPHARLIELLRYKARLKGIVLLETEESYTSKTSFITNEELRQYAPTTDGKTNHSQLEGKRSQLIFKIGNKRYHADINGSFNIIRKVFKNFAYDKKKVSLGYVLSELKLYGKKYFYEFYNSVREMAIPSHTKLNYTTN